MEVVRLTRCSTVRNLNLMSPLIFANERSGRMWSGYVARSSAVFVSWVLFPHALAAQWVPGRDLLDFPIGNLAEAPALASRARIGLWNPAAIAGREAARLSVGVAALTTPRDQGVSAQLLGGALRVPRGAIVGISVARASVSDLLRTDEDPRSLGELRYETTLVSALLARRSGEHLATGLAVRYRSGQLSGTRRSAVAIDGGVLLDGLGRRDARVAATTFLWSPANQDERPTYTGAADLRLAGVDSSGELRGGYSFSSTERSAREHFVFASGRHGIWEGRGGVARSESFGEARWRLRLGVGVYYSRYAVAVAREENGADLGAIYQFSLSSTVH